MSCVVFFSCNKKNNTQCVTKNFQHARRLLRHTNRQRVLCNPERIGQGLAAVGLVYAAFPIACVVFSATTLIAVASVVFAAVITAVITAAFTAAFTAVIATVITAAIALTTVIAAVVTAAVVTAALFDDHKKKASPRGGGSGMGQRVGNATYCFRRGRV